MDAQIKTYEVTTTNGTKIQFQSKKEINVVCVTFDKDENAQIFAKTSKSPWGDSYYRWINSTREKAVDYGFEEQKIEFRTVRIVADIESIVAKLNFEFDKLTATLNNPETARTIITQMVHRLYAVDSELKARL